MRSAWITDSLKSSVCSHLGILWEKKNRSQFEQNHILDDIHLRSSRKLPQVRFRGDLRRLPKIVQCCWQKEKQQVDVLADKSPFWETIPGHSMRETERETRSEHRWESLTFIFLGGHLPKNRLQNFRLPSPYSNFRQIQSLTLLNFVRKLSGLVTNPVKTCCYCGNALVWFTSAF